MHTRLQIEHRKALLSNFSPALRGGLQQRATAHGSEAVRAGETEVPAIVHEVLRSPGQPLDPAARAFFDPRLSHDFSRVPIYAPTSASNEVFNSPQSESCPLASASPRACPFGGACHACPARIQPKLTINQPRDEYEQEADGIAEQVMRMTDSPGHRDQRVFSKSDGFVVKMKCAKCDEDDGLLQMKEPEGQAPASEQSPGVPPIVHEVLRSPGQPLDAATRAFFEPRFGHDFRQVRVHTDARAAESARAVNALAYTVGQDIVFGAEQYAPDTRTGRRLLVHELAHVTQQRSARFASDAVSAPNDRSEQEAERLADSVLAGRAGVRPFFGSGVPRLQRSADSSSSASSGGAKGGSIPKPAPKEDGTCDCRLDLCWRPIEAYWGIIGALGYKHGFLNIVDSKCQTHNLSVDPSQHKAGSVNHSHAIDKTPGWDSSGTTCFTLNSRITCAHVDKLPVSTAKYEALDVAYDATGGPNSNSFLEWILNDVGIGIGGLPSGLKAWDYYVKNPSKRSSPPRVKRAAAPAGVPVPAGVTP